MSVDFHVEHRELINFLKERLELTREFCKRYKLTKLMHEKVEKRINKMIREIDENTKFIK